MSIARITTVKMDSKEAADDQTQGYVQNAPSEFPDAEILLFTRTGPTSAVVISVYPDKEISIQASAARKARMDKAAHRRKSAEMHQGEVILKLVR